MTYTFPQPNLTSGLDDAMIEVAGVVPIWPIMVLVFTYFVVLLGGVTSQNKRTGYADTPMWTLMASMSTFLLSLIMTMVGGILPTFVFGIVTAMTILTSFWYFMSRGKGEI